MPDKQLSDNRPIELTNYLEATAQKNDELIVKALADLESPKTRGKRKPTVETIARLTGLSPNTIRNRDWALKRLKTIKKALKGELEEKGVAPKNEESEDAILQRLRERITSLLEQNAVLYEEILSLHRTIERKDAEINKKGHRGK